MGVKVAACQVPDIREDTDAALALIIKFAREAESQDAAIVCFPECFLQGYLVEEELVRKHAIALSSRAFKQTLALLSGIKPVIVFGLIEKQYGRYCNTAVVVKEGRLLGKYRKTHLLDGEQVFEAGKDYPVFDEAGVCFGINICYDTQFQDASFAIAQQGASLILCPANNMMRRENAEKYKNLHHEMRIERATENSVWLVSADVTGTREGRIAYGPTSAISPIGEVIAQVPLMTTGMIIIEI